MLVHEFKEIVEVTTAKGDGYIWYMMDYGPQSDTLYTIIVKSTGECWQMTHKDFRIKANTTMGIAAEYKKMEPVKSLPRVEARADGPVSGVITGRYGVSNSDK